MVNKATIYGFMVPSPRRPVRIQAAEAIASEPLRGCHDASCVTGRQEDLNGWQVNREILKIYFKKITHMIFL